MKRLTIFISLLLAVLLVACNTADESVDSSNTESITTNESSEASDISAQNPENEVDTSKNFDTEQSPPNIDEPDTSDADTSVPDTSKPEADPYIGEITDYNMHVFELNINTLNKSIYLIHDPTDFDAFEDKINGEWPKEFDEFIRSNICEPPGGDSDWVCCLDHKSWIIVCIECHVADTEYFIDELYGAKDGIHLSIDCVAPSGARSETKKVVVIVEADKKYMGGVDVVHLSLTDPVGRGNSLKYISDDNYDVPEESPGKTDAYYGEGVFQTWEDYLSYDWEYKLGYETNDMFHLITPEVLEPLTLTTIDAQGYNKEYRFLSNEHSLSITPLITEGQKLKKGWDFCSEDWLRNREIRIYSDINDFIPPCNTIDFSRYSAYKYTKEGIDVYLVRPCESDDYRICFRIGDFGFEVSSKYFTYDAVNAATFPGEEEYEQMSEFRDAAYGFYELNNIYTEDSTIIRNLKEIILG